MQQMISFVPTMPTKANQLPVTGTGEQVGAGIFQGILLEAMLGARGAQAAVQALPGRPAAQPGAQSQAQTSAQAGEAQLTGALISQGDAAAPVPTPAQAATAAQAPVVPEAGAPGLPIRLIGPVPPTTVAVESATPTEEEVGEQVTPAAPETDAALMAQLQASQVQASVAQAQTQAMPQPPASEPQDPAPGQQALPAIPDRSQAGAELEAFVQKAVQATQGETQVPTEVSEPAQDEAAPTFQDLVKLVMDADKARPGTGSSQSDSGSGQPQGQSTAYAAEAAPPAAEEPAPDQGTVAASPEPAPAHRPSATAAAEAPQEAPRAPVEPEPVLRQVTRFIKVMVDAKQSEVRLNLHPEHLGHIAVKLVVGDGAIRANLVAQDMAVKAALEANLEHLKTRLSDQGFQVEQVHVTVGSESGLPQHSRQGEQRQPQHRQQHTWRPNRGEDSSQQDPARTQTLSRPAPAPWSVRGTGVRLNSLA